METSLLNLLLRALFILMMMSGLSAKGQSLMVEFAEDTIYSCQWASVTLSPSVSGQQGNVNWSWSTGDTGPTAYVLSSSIGIDTVVVSVSDASGGMASDTAYIFILQECVLPGDADGNGLANNFDVLPIGRSFSSVGPIRPNAHNNFIGQAAPDWGSLNSAGVDQVHSDANGDGLVEWQDFDVIDFNYFQPQFTGASGNLPNGVPFYVDFPPGPFNPGDTIKAPIILGSAANPASNIIGIAFSIVYDNTLIDSASVRIEYDGSWLGDAGVDMVGLDKDFYQAGQVDIGISRLDQQARSSYGKVGDIIVAIDDIAGKGEMLDMEIALANVSLLDAQGTFLPVDTDRSNVQIALNLEQELAAIKSLTLFPNPAQGSVQFRLDENLLSGPAELRIFDQLGRQVMSKNLLLSNDNSLDISRLSKGVYTINIYAKNKIYSNRLSVL